MRPRANLKWTIIIACTLALAGCVVSEYGDAAIYNARTERQITVIMPPNAPSITQQFRTSSLGISAGGPATQHEGIDINAAIGTPIIAAAPGTIVQARFEPVYGNRLVVDHGIDETGLRTRTIYMHLDERSADVGDTVARGQQIGTMGRTGVLAGGIVHLHFEVHRQRRPHGLLASDPHLFWADGVGRVTCYDPAISNDDTRFRTTYPVPCPPLEQVAGRR